MKLKIYVWMLVLFVVLSGNVFATDFDNIDRVMFAVASFSLLADASQTMQIQYHENHFERNRMLGKHPTNERVTLYFGLVIPATFVISRYILDGPWRKVYLGAVTLYELNTVRNNSLNGLTNGFSLDTHSYFHFGINVISGVAVQSIFPEWNAPTKVIVATLPMMYKEFFMDGYIDAGDIFFNLLGAYVGVATTGHLTVTKNMVYYTKRF
jgi:hypothetical protein